MELFAFSKFGSGKGVVIVVSCKFDDGVVEEETLDHDFAGEFTPAGPAGYLSDELENVFVRSEVGDVEAAVGA